MATNTPTILDDILNGTKNADTISGLAGNDKISGGAGEDTLSGDEGDDKVDGGAGADKLYGGAGADSLVGGGDNDLLVGGADNDWLNGGGGADTYAFKFTVTSTTATTVTFGGFDAGTDGKLTQGEFSSQYSNWLKSVGVDGSDANTTVDFTWAQNSPTDALTSLEGGNANGAVVAINIWLGTGKGEHQEVRYYEPTVTIGQATLSITSSDGHDTIEQFQNAGPNVDKIVMEGLSGLTATQLDSLFDLANSDVNLDGTIDSVLSWTGGSLTVLGTAQWGTSVNAFFTSSQVQIA